MEGEEGKALKFDGEDDYIEVKNDEKLDLQEFSLVVNLRLDDGNTAGDSYARVVANGDYDTKTGWYLRGRPDNSKIVFRGGNGTALSNHLRTNLRQKNGFETVTVTFNHNKSKILREGKFKNSENLNISYESKLSFRIAAQSDESAGFLSGTITEVRLYDQEFNNGAVVAASRGEKSYIGVMDESVTLLLVLATFLVATGGSKCDL